MIFSKIKKYFLQKEIQQSSKTSKRAVVNNKIKNIGIVSTMALNDVHEFQEKVKKLFPEYRSVTGIATENSIKVTKNPFIIFLVMILIGKEKSMM